MSTTLFCLDFDETLFNTDRLRADLAESIHRLGGEGLADAYEAAYEAVRHERDGVSIPLVLSALGERSEVDEGARRRLAELFHAHPYQEYVYTGAEAAIAHLKERGRAIIFSDGDAFFQPQKIYATTLSTLVDGIIILPSKITFLKELAGYWPADQYVFIDDKQRVLNSAKEYFGEKTTTVFVKQGRYAGAATPSTADLSASSIADVPGLFP